MPHPSHTARRRPILLAALLIPLAACGTDDPRTEPGQPAADVPAAPASAEGAAAPRDACELMSPGEVSAAAGIGEATGQSSTSGGAQVCTWTDANGRSAILQVYPTAARYEESRQAFQSLYGGQAEDVSGIGDRAFYIGGRTGPVPTASVSAVEGGTAISAQVMGMNEDAESLRSGALELAQRALQKL